MNGQTFWRALLPLLALTLIAGAIPTATGNEIFEETVEKTYPVQSNARFRLKNEDGSVWIYGANISEMKVRAVKRAYRKDRLAEIKVNIVVRPDAVTIDTSFPPKPKWGLSDRSGTVEYLIILPWFCDVEKVELGAGEILIDGMRGDQVRAELGSGRMFGYNCFTDMHLSLSSGALEVGYGWWEPHGLALHTRIASGNMRVFIPVDAQFRLQAETTNGQVITDFPNNRPSASAARLDMAIGDQPNAEMNIRTVSGNVIIKEINR